MFEELKRQGRLCWRELAAGIPVAFGGFVFGTALFGIIRHFDETANTFVPLGTIFAAIAAAFYLFILICCDTAVYFPLQVSMGFTRKKFFLSYHIIMLLSVPGFFLWLCLLGTAEKKFFSFMYPQMDMELDVLPYIVRFGIPAGILLVLTAILCTAVVIRFGKVAFWILWGFWMIINLGGPRIHDLLELYPQSVPARAAAEAAKLLSSVPVGSWALLGVLAGGLAMGISYRLLRKQEVKL